MKKFLLAVGMIITSATSGAAQGTSDLKEKETSRQVLQGTPLTATVQAVGVRPTVSTKERAAAVADLRIIFTCGKKGSPVKATLTVTLNTSVAGVGTARLVDEAAGSEVASATKSGKAYVFKDVQFTAPGPDASRTLRITNVRANANAFGTAGTLIPNQITAFVTVSSSTPIRLSTAKQAVASLKSDRP